MIKGHISFHSVVGRTCKPIKQGRTRGSRRIESSTSILSMLVISKKVRTHLCLIVTCIELALVAVTHTSPGKNL